MKKDFNFKDFAAAIKAAVKRENDDATSAYKWTVKAINKNSIVLHWDYDVSFMITKPEPFYEDCFLIKSVCDYGFGLNSEKTETWILADIGDKYSDYMTIDEAIPGIVSATIQKACHLF